MSGLYFDLGVAMADLRTGALTRQWGQWITDLFGQVDANTTAVSGVPGVNKKTFAQVNALGLGSSDAGYLAWVTDYAHQVYWDGAAWQWLDGDRPTRFGDFATNPGVGWALCDGTATTYLTVGGMSLVATAFTTPNLSGTAAYRKSAAAYTGTVTAASGSTGTGTTGTGTTGTGTTGTGVTGTGTTGTPSSSAGPVAFGVDVTVGSSLHTHTVPALSVPGLSVPGLSVPGLSVPALGVGSVDMAHVDVLPYVRR